MIDETMTERPGLTSTDTKYTLASRMIANMRAQLDYLEQLILSPDDLDEVLLADDLGRWKGEMNATKSGVRVLEGVFDGESMVGEDGERYPVPQNYASKSKLVEGDLLRLTVTPRGQFLYKQRGPIERQRLVGMLIQDENTGDWIALANGCKFCLLNAAISYFKGEPGDEVVLLVPKGEPSQWAAVENVIRRELSAGSA